MHKEKTEHKLEQFNFDNQFIILVEVTAQDIKMELHKACG